MLGGGCGTCSDQYLTVDCQLVLYIYIYIYIHTQTHTRGAAGKSLARPTYQCRRTGLIVSLERGICSCRELQVFSCYRGWKEECQATRAILNNMETRAVIKIFSPPARQGAEGNSRHSDRNIKGTMHYRMPRSKTGWSSLNVVIFLLVMRLVLDDPKQWPHRRLFITFTS